MHLPIREDLWQYLSSTEKPIVMYGMGNGADKIIRALDERGITVSDFFASDGFVRGHTFHGKTVLSYADVKEKYGKGNFIVLLSFATALDDVLSRIQMIADETELYAPDIPVVPNESATDAEVFDLAYFHAHENEIDAAYAMLADERSRALFRDVLCYRLTGRIDYLLDCVDTREEVYTSLLTPAHYERYADLGAYNGDTIREILPYAPAMREVYAMEPDPRNFRKLSEYAETETRTRIISWNVAAHDRAEILRFDGSGNRNATLIAGAATPKRIKEVEANALSALLKEYGSPKIDYIKLDVEGAERTALRGCLDTIRNDRPALLISLYHRREDLFDLPLTFRALLGDLASGYDFYLRRFRYIPAWDLNFYAIPKT